MPARLSPEERAARKKERSRRSFSEAAYTNRYDPATEGFGSPDDWRSTVEARLGFELVEEPITAEVDSNLVLLGLTKLPASRELLHAAYRAASKKSHPNAGGTDAAFIAVRQAYDKLRLKIRG